MSDDFGNDCLKCGALLPDGDEGICPSCGSPFGKATMAMKIDPGELAAIAARTRRDKEAKAAAEAPASVVAPQAAESSIPMGLIAGGVAVVIALVVVLLLVM